VKRFTQFVLLVLFLLPLSAYAAEMRGVRVWTAPDHTRLVFDISSPVQYNVFPLHSPERLVIDLKKSRPGKKFEPDGVGNALLKGLRYAHRPNDDLRIVLDLQHHVRPKSFLLQPNASYGHRLVIDLYGKAAKTAKPKIAKSAEDIKAVRDVVIAIDAGHGGEDPGARGPVYKTKEKRITLQIAKRLKRLIDAQKGMRAVLTRTGDYYVGLRKRMQIARKHRADLFVSVHADAFRDKRVRGSSVYVLSNRGASSEAARWLAKRENAADLVGGVSLDDKDKVLASVLLDLSQSATQEASLSAANKVYKKLHRVGKVHGRRVQQAGFLVLKSPDIPSMLVETGFISNPTEENNLRNPKYQQRLANSVMQGIRQYFHDAPPPGTVLAKNQQKKSPREHVIGHGDTLAEIAQRYQVSVSGLRRENRIKNDDLIRIGRVLRIPGS
jgi:N-acetylmuramoyl-L-alanine amidase